MFLLVLESFGLDILVFFVVMFLCALTGDAQIAGIIIFFYGLFYLVIIGLVKLADVFDRIYEYENNNVVRFFKVLFIITYIASSIFFVYTLCNLGLPVWDTEYENSETVTQEYELTSIRFGVEASKNDDTFLIVSKGSDGNDVYTYYSLVDATYKKEELVSNNVRIKQDSTSTPKLVEYAPCQNEKTLKNGEVVETEQVNIDDNPEKLRYEFIVPEGTVVQEDS